MYCYVFRTCFPYLISSYSLVSLKSEEKKTKQLQNNETQCEKDQNCVDPVRCSLVLTKLVVLKSYATTMYVFRDICL
jgi:multisubunit Na+/H+ antiporter MnhC subunit